MLNRIRERLTYANVMSTLAVFIALGGSSYAAATISGSIDQEPLDRRQASCKHNTLTGAQIKESKLATRAARAQRRPRRRRRPQQT